MTKRAHLELTSPFNADMCLSRLRNRVRQEQREATDRNRNALFALLQRREQIDLDTQQVDVDLHEFYITKREFIFFDVTLQGYLKKPNAKETLVLCNVQISALSYIFMTMLFAAVAVGLIALGSAGRADNRTVLLAIWIGAGLFAALLAGLFYMFVLDGMRQSLLRLTLDALRQPDLEQSGRAFVAPPSEREDAYIASVSENLRKRKRDGQ
jgi:hypothetical protein